MNRSLTRRNFIKITAVAGATLGAGGLIRHLQPSGRLERVIERRVLMGSAASLTILAEDEDLARQAITATFDEMARLEAVLSRFQSSSQLNQLNHSGYLEKMDESLAEVLLQAKDIWSLTQGAFDITIEPLLAGYRQAAERGQSLSRDQVEALLALVGQEELTLTAGEARLGRAGMAITLDGIAKGFIIDQGVKTLGGHGFDRVMVEVGGDLQATGGVDEAWRVGIQAPRKEFDGYLGIVELPQGAMATSGDYMNAFSEDFSAHHILDPRSGRSPAQVASVTTLAPSAMLSDALSTALMVLGPQAGLELVEGLPQVEALLVGKDLKQYLSSGFVLL